MVGLDKSEPQHGSEKTPIRVMGTPQTKVAGWRSLLSGRKGWFSYPMLYGLGAAGENLIPKRHSWGCRSTKLLPSFQERDLSNAPQWPLQTLITSAHSGEREQGSHRPDPL